MRGDSGVCRSSPRLAMRVRFFLSKRSQRKSIDVREVSEAQRPGSRRRFDGQPRFSARSLGLVAAAVVVLVAEVVEGLAAGTAVIVATTAERTAALMVAIGASITLIAGILPWIERTTSITSIEMAISIETPMPASQRASHFDANQWNGNWNGNRLAADANVAAVDRAVGPYGWGYGGLGYGAAAAAGVGYGAGYPFFAMYGTGGYGGGYSRRRLLRQHQYWRQTIPTTTATPLRRQLLSSIPPRTTIKSRRPRSSRLKAKPISKPGIISCRAGLAACPDRYAA